jgi:hypothetical protein
MNRSVSFNVSDFTLQVGKIQVGNSKLVLWDLGGQQGLRSIWDKYYEESHAIIFVVDSADASRFEEAKRTFGKLISPTSFRGSSQTFYFRRNSPTPRLERYSTFIISQQKRLRTLTHRKRNQKDIF